MTLLQEVVQRLFEEDEQGTEKDAETQEQRAVQASAVRSGSKRSAINEDLPI